MVPFTFFHIDSMITSLLLLFLRADLDQERVQRRRTERGQHASASSVDNTDASSSGEDANNEAGAKEQQQQQQQTPRSSSSSSSNGIIPARKLIVSVTRMDGILAEFHRTSCSPKIDELRARINELEEDNAELRSLNLTLQRRARDRDSQARTNLRDCRFELQEVRSDVNRLRRDRNVLRDEVNHLYGELDWLAEDRSVLIRRCQRYRRHNRARRTALRNAAGGNVTDGVHNESVFEYTDMEEASHGESGQGSDSSLNAPENNAPGEDGNDDGRSNAVNAASHDAAHNSADSSIGGEEEENEQAAAAVAAAVDAVSQDPGAFIPTAIRERVMQERGTREDAGANAAAAAAALLRVDQQQQQWQ